MVLRHMALTRERGWARTSAILFLIFIISARSAHGQDCGRSYNSRKGIIMSPSYPHPYGYNMNCVYVIRQPEGYRITLTFQDFQLENGGDRCIYDYVEIRDGGSETSPLIGRRLCGSILPKPRRTSQNEMWIRFRSDDYMNKNGFKAVYTTDTEANGVMLLSVGNKIQRLDISTQTDYDIPISGIADPTAIDYDPLEDRVYWTSDFKYELRSAFLDGSDNRLLYDLHSEARDIAIDSSSRLLFYTDDENDVISFVTLSGKYHKNIINTDLDKPRALALHTTEGLVFWTDVGINSKIERANYDGSNRRLVFNTSLLQPIALTVDIYNGRLYWIDAGTSKVEWSTLDGGQRSVILSSVDTHYFDFDLYKNHLYITDWGNWSLGGRETYIRDVDVSNGNTTLFHHARDLIKHIRIFSADLNTTERNGCSVNNGNCSHICVQLTGNISCLCPDGYEWSAEQRTCIQGANPCSNGGCSGRCILLSSSEKKCTCPKGQFLDIDNKTCISACGGNFTSAQGVIQSPAYRNKYDHNLKCIYVITRPEGYYITINFTDFQLAGNCNADYVEIRDGKDLTSPLLSKRLCGDNVTSTLRTTQNVMLIVFNTDSSVSGKGFHAYFTSGILQHEMILMTLDNSVIRMDLDTYTTRSISINNLKQPVSIDYDPTTGRVYWADLSKSTINSAFLNGSDSTPLLHFGDGEELTGVALDFKSKLLFYADSVNNVIGLVTLSGQYRKALIDTEHDNPRVIALDDTQGILFWATWSIESKIERSAYNGSDRKTLVSTELTEPNALAVDKENQRLYWVDSYLKTLEWIDFDGVERTTMHLSLDSKLIGVALFQSHIYVINRNTILEEKKEREESYLHRMNIDGSELTRVAAMSGSLKDIHIVSDQINDEDMNGCTTNNGGCDKICIPLPNNGSQCDCPNGEIWNFTQLKCVYDQAQDPCANSGNCSHFCIPLTNKRRKCQCPFKTTLDKDELTCIISCGGEYSGDRGSITSTSINKEEDCVYIIRQPQGRIIQLTFTDFNVGYYWFYDVCFGDFLEVRDGINETAPLLKILCGWKIPPKITSSTNSMWIHFRSTGYDYHSAFTAFYQSVPDPKTTTSATTIDSTTASVITNPSTPYMFTPFITGPSPFYTDGSQELALTCNVDNLSGKNITWNVPCSKQQGSTCTIVPKPPIDDGMNITCTVRDVTGNSSRAMFTVNLLYLPTAPPEITIEKARHFPDDSNLRLACSVKGGKPLVNSLTFSCNIESDYFNDSFSETDVRKVLVFESQQSRVNDITCQCKAQWNYTDLYNMTTWKIILKEGAASESEEHDVHAKDSVKASVVTAFVVFIVMVIIIAATVLLRRKGLCFYHGFQRFNVTVPVSFSELFKRNREEKSDTNGVQTLTESQAENTSDTQPVYRGNPPVQGENSDTDLLSMYF